MEAAARGHRCVAENGTIVCVRGQENDSTPGIYTDPKQPLLTVAKIHRWIEFSFEALGPSLAAAECTPATVHGESEQNFPILELLEVRI